jgi:toxin CptA
MHTAPSVSYPVGRSAFAGFLLAAIAVLGLLAATAWSIQSPVFTWRQSLAFLAVLACGLFAGRGWLASPRGVLRWDGVGWQWQQAEAAQAGQPEIALDLQARMLLRFRAEEGGVHWFWLERKSDASHWDALRRAVYSRASAPIPLPGEPTPPAGKPPAAEP